ncbi:MAG: zinc ribbon domain-containing protein [Bacilli bacterium]|nr:zinc ribbon domain-containing protein [Bacilli bacterium]
MSNKLCRNCGAKIKGKKCLECGYDIELDKPFENIITDKNYKENIADIVLAFLIDKKLISKDKDLKHLRVEFGYLLLPENTENVCALLKVITPSKILKKSKTFYLSIQEGNMMLLDNHFDEAMFQKVSSDMLVMHKVDVNNLNKKDYIMELY